MALSGRTPKAAGTKSNRKVAAAAATTPAEKPAKRATTPKKRKTKAASAPVSVDIAPVAPTAAPTSADSSAGVAIEAVVVKEQPAEAAVGPVAEPAPAKPATAKRSAGKKTSAAAPPAKSLAEKPVEATAEVPAEINDADLDPLTRCERRIGYNFRNRRLLLEALTHASGAQHRLASNERLEFLGDAILGAIVCEILFERYPEYLEGDLTKIKSAVVSRQSCAKISEALGMQECLIVGKGILTGKAIPPSLLADVFESLIAAMYLDGGNEAVTRFVHACIGPEIELTASGELGGNYKSLLQQLAQREFASTPVYQLLDEKGPDHRKVFKVAAVVRGRHYAAAWGRNKKEAEQRAACNALDEINGESPQFPCD